MSMIIKDISAKNFYSCWLTSIAFLTSYNYLADCLLNFKVAIVNTNFILVYLINALYRFYLVFPAIIIYYFLFRKKTNLFFAVIYVLVIAYIVFWLLYPDEWSLYNGEYRKAKMMCVYMLSGLSTFFVYEVKLRDRTRSLD